MLSRDVKHLSFRCQTFKFSRPNVKFYFSTLLKVKMILINKKGRNYQKGVPLSAICGIKWKNLSRIILFQKLGEDLGAVSKIIKHYTSHLGRKTSKFDTWNSDVWRHMKTCFARVRSQVDAIDRMTLEWNFWRGGGVQTKKPSVGGVYGYFLEQHKLLL